MATPFLALNHRSGTPQLKRYINANPTNTGVTFGAADANGGYATPNDFFNRSPVVQYMGSNTLFAVVGNQVYRSTDSAASWTSVRTLTNLVASIQSAKSGLYVLYSNGLPELTVVYRSATNVFYVDTSQDGTTWTTYGPFALNASWGWSPFCGESVWDGKLALLGSDGPGLNLYLCALYDPNTHTITSVISPNLSGQATNGTLCVYRDRLFALISRGTGTGQNYVSIYEVTGSGISFLMDLDTAAMTAPDPSSRWGMFVSGSKLYALYWKSAAAGWRCKEIDSTFTVTDVTSSVIPAGMTGGASTSRVGVLVDNNSNPGAAPNIYIFHATDGGTSTAWSMYQWNGAASTMTGVGTPGGLASDAMPFALGSQGHTFWTTDERHVEILGRTFLPGKIRLSFKMFSASGTETVVARVWYTTATNAYPTTAATLSNASAGSITGNAISGLTADNTTTYQVSWDAQTDGLNAGDFAKIIIESSLT